MSQQMSDLQAPLQQLHTLCGCCLEEFPPATSPSGHCKTCSEDGSSVAAHLCSRCAMKHTLPANFKRLANHKFELLSSAGSLLLQQIGLSVSGVDFCTRHPGEMLRFFCRDRLCGCAVCVHCLHDHRGHAFEEVAVVRDSLRAALVAKVFSTPCWGSTSSSEPHAFVAPTTALVPDERALKALLGAPPRAVAELRSRLDAIAEVCC